MFWSSQKSSSHSTTFNLHQSTLGTATSQPSIEPPPPIPPVPRAPVITQVQGHSHTHTQDVRPVGLSARGVAGLVAVAVLSALTTVASFGTLGLAEHRGMASLGALLTLGIAMILVCNLAVLPALVRATTRRAP